MKEAMLPSRRQDRMNALDILKSLSSTLAASGIEAAEREAELFVMSLLKADRAALYAHNPEIAPEQISAVDPMVQRRCAREPLQYILGFCDFHDLKILVGQGVLIPRPETEIMAEQAIRHLGEMGAEKNRSLSVLDLCTGSGCLALSIAKAFPQTCVYGSELSPAALHYAEQNAALNDIDNVAFIRGDLLEHFRRGSLDCIVANPPYIRTAEINTLQPEIRDWEPVAALDGGPDGLDMYRKIVVQAMETLRPGGMLMVETADDEAEEILDLMEAGGYAHTQIIRDFAGLRRIVRAVWTR